MISSVGDVKTQIKAGEAGFPRQAGTNNPQVHKIRDPPVGGTAGEFFSQQHQEFLRASLHFSFF